MMQTHLNPIQAGWDALSAVISPTLPVTLVLAEADGAGQLLQLLAAEALLLVAAQGGQLLQDAPTGQVEGGLQHQGTGSLMVPYRPAKALLL